MIYYCNMPNSKIKILFDATLLLNDTTSDGKRAGQYFVALNLLKQLLEKEELHITLFSEYRRYIFLSEFVRKHLKDYSKFSVYSYNTWLDRFAISVSRFLLKHQKKYVYSKILRKFVRFIGYRIFYIYERFFSKLDLKDYDAFFTPSEPITPDIMSVKHLKKYAFLHDTVPISLKDFYLYNNPFMNWYNCLENSLSPECTYFTNSETTKSDFLTYYPFLSDKQFSVALLGAAERFTPVKNQDLIKSVKLKYGLPTDKKFAFVLSSLDQRKNFFFILDNFIEFVTRYEIDDIILVIAGAVKEDYVEVFEDKLASIPEHLKDKIFWIGYVDDLDVPVLYSGALMFLMPSIYEGFGMPILEAMKCACPVICSNTSAMPEVIGDCGIMIDPYENEELISAICKMYFNENFRKVCIAKGLSRAKNFSWQHCAGVIADKIISDFSAQK